MLRKIVVETISRLDEMDPSQVLGRELSMLERRPENSPVREALAACRDELRDECGLARLDGRPEREATSPALSSHEWAASYKDALEKYRDAAGTLLDRVLNDRQPDALGGSADAAPGKAVWR